MFMYKSTLIYWILRSKLLMTSEVADKWLTHSMPGYKMAGFKFHLQ